MGLFFASDDITMDIVYSVDYKANTEVIGIGNTIFSFNNDDRGLQNVDHDRCGFTISLTSSSEIEIHDKLYYTVCNILDADYSELSAKIHSLLDTPIPMSIVNVELRTQVFLALKAISPLLPGMEIFEGLTERLFNCYTGTSPPALCCTEQTVLSYFSNYLLLQAYVADILKGSADVRKPDTFRKFAHYVLHTGVPLEGTEGFQNSRLGEGLVLPQIEDEFNRFMNTPTILNPTSDVYVCKNALEVCVASLISVLNNNHSFKRCDNCGRLFVPYNRSDTLYCDRPSPQDCSRSCKEYGWYEKQRNNEAKSLARTIYMVKQMRAKRSKGKPEHECYLLAFNNYKKQKIQWEADVEAGRKTEQEYIDWLKEIKERKTP